MIPIEVAISIGLAIGTALFTVLWFLGRHLLRAVWKLQSDVTSILINFAELRTVVKSVVEDQKRDDGRISLLEGSRYDH